VGVKVDEARRDGEPGRVDGSPGGGAGQGTHRGDPVALDPDVGPHGRAAAAVDHDPVADQDVEHGSRSRSALRWLQGFSPAQGVPHGQ
jgi:hypothetical protein